SVRGEERGETVLCLHDLFRDCLEERLRNEMPKELPALLRRAADTETDLVRRIGYLARAGDWAVAEQTLYTQGPALLARGAVVPRPAFVGLAGTRAPLQRYIDGALRRTPEEPPSPVRVLAQALQAGLWLWDGRVDEAAELLARADNAARWLNRPPNVAGYINL